MNDAIFFEPERTPAITVKSKNKLTDAIKSPSLKPRFVIETSLPIAEFCGSTANTFAAMSGGVKVISAEIMFAKSNCSVENSSAFNPLSEAKARLMLGSVKLTPSTDPLVNASAKLTASSEGV